MHFIVALTLLLSTQGAMGTTRMALVRADKAGHDTHRLKIQSVLHRVRTKTHRTFDSYNHNALRRCAIVGSGDVLTGAELGAEIDHHDLVVRINRLPTESYYKDFGNKTSILFALGKRDVHGHGRIALMSPHDENINALREKHIVHSDDAWTKKCNTPHWTVPAGPLCKFDALMLWSLAPNATAPHTNMRKLMRIWRRSRIPAAFVMLNVRNAAQYLLKANGLEDGRQPTSGFMAVATFAPICEELTLYGFESRGEERLAADGHPAQSDRHDLALEHSVLRRIITGEMERSYSWKKGVPAELLAWIEKHLTNADATNIRFRHR